MPRQARFNAKRFSVVLLDSAIVLSAYVLAFFLRFDLRLNWENLHVIQQTAPYLLPYLAAFWAFSLYRGIYYFSSFDDLLNITQAVIVGGFMSDAAILFVRQGQFPRSVLLLHPIITFLGVGWIRFGIRMVKSWFNLPRAYSGGYREVLIVGAGELGESLSRQMRKTLEPRYRVVGFIDDDSAKWGRHIHGRPVFGGRRFIGSVLERHHVDEIVIAISARRGEIVRSIVEAMRSREEKPQLKIAPGLEEMLRAPHATTASSLRKLRPADLLNREVIRLDMERIAHFLQGKTVLVTGAGGTIGSELCRQVLQYAPAKLVMVESHATSLFYVAGELQGKAPESEVVPLLGDIRDQALIDRIFKEYRPHVVLHAAAHKHVHQLEFNVHEGVGNNVLGTYYMANAAEKYEAEAFLLVSTDKAVKPTSVMGATKRAAEFIVKNFAARSAKTRFVAVRFGNVLGSSGSVLEIFQKQIAEGGPITVTHPEVTRYFMTVEEAVQLILQAAAMAKGGEIFVLKMGTPVKILDLARNVLLLSGLEPGKDIEIRFTGLKQGEKMGEELVENPAHCDDSEHPSIMILRPDGELAERAEKATVDLEILTRTASKETLIAKLAGLVPTFVPAPAHRLAPEPVAPMAAPAPEPADPDPVS